MLHVVSRTQQGRQREPSVKRLASPTFRRILETFRVEWRNSTPRFSSTPERRNKTINLNKYLCFNIFKVLLLLLEKKNIWFPRVGIGPTTDRVYSHICAPAPQLASITNFVYNYQNIDYPQKYEQGPRVRRVVRRGGLLRWYFPPPEASERAGQRDIQM